MDPFFVTSKLETTSSPPSSSTRRHLLFVRKNCTVPYDGELTSLTGNGKTSYVAADPTNQKWIVTFRCVGTAPVQFDSAVAVTSGGKAVLHTVSMRAKRPTWSDWDDTNIQPAIEVAE